MHRRSGAIKFVLSALMGPTDNSNNNLFTAILSPHGIAMRKGLYFTAVVFSFFVSFFDA